MIEVLIVEDEPLARARLRRLIEGEPDLKVLGECMNGQEAIAAIREASPHLVFLDIEMPDMSGFDVLESLPSSRRPAVVFVTAYDEFAVRAFEVRALDYLLKPFDASRFADTLARVRVQLATPRDRALGAVLGVLEDLRAHQRAIERSMRVEHHPWPERLVVRSGQELLFVPVTDVDWFQAADNYVELHVGKVVHVMRETLTAVERHLDPGRFVRVRRDAIVNLARIQAVRPGLDGEPEVVLKSGASIRLGRAYRSRVTARWQGLAGVETEER